MRGIAMLFGAEWRRRRAAWIALAVLVSIIGATVLVGASAATRTSSAFPQFLGRYGYDAEAFGLSPFPEKLYQLPGVDKIALSTYYFNGNVTAGGHFVPGEDVNVMSLPTTHLSSTVKLLSGRYPVGAKEILVGYSMQQQYGLRIGSIVTVPTYAPDQRQAVLIDNQSPRARGPRLNFRVAGVAASAVDFATTSPSYSVYTSDAFDRGHYPALLSAALAFVRLRGGEGGMPKFQYAANHMSKTLGQYFTEDMGSATSAIEESINPQAVGWWLFALFATLAGLILIGQALVRQSLTERESSPTLAALGMRPIELFGLGVSRALAIGFAGALGLVGLAYLLSPSVPVGIARAASVQRGFVFDVPTLVLGLFVIVAVVRVLALWPAWRASQVQVERVRGDRLVTSNISAAAVVARTGAPPSVLIGVRNALERGRGRTSVPVVTALVGTVLAVAALVATTIFGASLSHLLATPRLYGANWRVNLDNVTTKQLRAALPELKDNPEVTRITYGGVGKYLQVGSVAVESAYLTTAKGPMVPSLDSGHYPTRDGQIALGETTLAKARLHVGSRAAVSVVNPNGASHTSRFLVVGTVTFPPSLGIGGLGDGAVITIHALELLACPEGPTRQTCLSEVNNKIDGNTWGLAIGVKPGAAGRAAEATLDRKYAADLSVQTRPTNLVNFGQAIDFPLLLEGTLVLFGVSALAHLLFVSVTRRRRQFALLKVLGFVRRQVRSAMCWQAATVAVIGVVVGVPIGLVFGQFIWRDFAISLGAVPVAVAPTTTILILAVATVGGAVVLALVPATLAAQVQPADALRES